MKKMIAVFMFACAVLGSTVSAVAQQSEGKIPRIGYISNGNLGLIEEAFRQGLRDLGFVEGRNIIVEWRFAEQQTDRLPGLIAGLIGLPVDIIVTRSTQVTTLARNATKTIPIVMTAVGDPIGSGAIASLARPGSPTSVRSAV